MRRWFQFYGQALIEILICGILGIIVALLADHYYFHWNLLEKSFGSFRSSEEVVSEGEADTESSPLRYLVNRRYDGTGSEYVYADGRRRSRCNDTSGRRLPVSRERRRLYSGSGDALV